MPLLNETQVINAVKEALNEHPIIILPIFLGEDCNKTNWLSYVAIVCLPLAKMTPQTVQRTLRKPYYDPAHPAAFGSATQLYRSARKQLKNLTMKDVKDSLERQTAYTMHRHVRLKFKRRKTYARHVDHIWQMDLVSLQAIAKENAGYNYILTVIDILSRYAFAWNTKLARKWRLLPSNS